MKRVYIKPPPAPNYLSNGVFRINDGHNIFWNIDRKLALKDIVVSTIDLDKKNDGDLYVYSDVPYPWEVKLWLKTITTRNRNILFCFESPIVNPFSHLPLFHFFFRKVYAWDNRLVDNVRYFKFYIPQLSVGLHTKPIDFKRKKFLAFINAKKNVPFIFPMLSPYKTNLYKKRFQALDYFSSNIPSKFDIFGKGWDKPILWDLKEWILGVKKYQSYRGELKSDKIKSLSNYKFCLCFENAIAPGYITEKIFDCLKARCVPIYLGAPDIGKYIPINCFIDFRKFISYRNLLRFLESVDEKRYNKYIDNIESFINNKVKKNKWFNKNFEEIFIKAM